MGQTGNPFARKEHVPCATVLSTMNGPNRKRSPEDTSTAIIDSFLKSRSRYGNESVALGGSQRGQKQSSTGVVERNQVPRKTVQVSLASLQARKKYDDASRASRMDARKVRNSGGPIDLEPGWELHHSVASSSQQSGGMHNFTKKQWRMSANGFKPPRVVDPDAHKKFLSRQESWKESGSGEIENKVNGNKQRRTLQGESEASGLMENKKIMSRGEASKGANELPAVCIEEINLVDDDDDLAEAPCKEKAQDISPQCTDVEVSSDGGGQEDLLFSNKSRIHGSQYQSKGTGVAIFDDFSSEYCDSDDEYGSDYEEEIAGAEWDDSHQHENDDNVSNVVQSLSMPGSRLENATIMVDGKYQPWWKRLTDFVPISALRSGFDPRDGSKVHIDYMGQFSGTRSKPSSDAVGIGAKKKRARTTKTADGYWVTEDGVKSFVTNDGNRLTGKAAYAAYLKKKQAKKPTKKRRKRAKKARKK